jgi:hypothetical protein
MFFTLLLSHWWSAQLTRTERKTILLIKQQGYKNFCLWKEILTSDGQQFHQYQQNE